MARLTLRVSFNGFALAGLAMPPLLFRDQNQGCARTPVASVIDPADASHQRVFGVLDLALSGFAAQLAHRLHEIMRRARGLTRGDLTTAGVEGQIAIEGEIMLADERHALARLAEAEGFELQHDGDDEIIVRVERGDVLDGQPRLGERFLTADLVAALGHIDQVLAALEVGPLGVADWDDALRQTLLLRALTAHHEQA